MKQNMPLDRTPESNAFAAWLLDIGAGCGLGPGDSVQLPVRATLKAEGEAQTSQGRSKVNI